MGFYGNIKNTSKTQFQFDKIYANRYEMDLNCSSDGIYTGRYVLIEYDRVPAGMSLDSFITNSNPNYSLNNLYCIEGNMYTAESFAPPYILVDSSSMIRPNGVNDIEVNTLTMVKAGHNIYNIGPVNTEYKKLVSQNGELIPTTITKEQYDQLHEGENHNYLVIENGIIKNTDSWVTENAVCILEKGYQYWTNTEDQYWIMKEIYTKSVLNDQGSTVDITLYKWEQLTNDGSSTYMANFGIDKAFYYDLRRGYDSTVWQKVYSSGREKYVQIAELNSVVPTFAVSADAPKLIPISPHFDTSSTNIYYLMHTSSQWGMRIKAANPDLSAPTLLPSGGFSTLGKMPLRRVDVDKKYYPSDAKMQWNEQFAVEINQYGTATNNDGYLGTDTLTTLGYNPIKQDWEKEEAGFDIDAAIYFNKDGFDSKKIAYSRDIIDPNQAVKGNYNKTIADSNWQNTNEINITPTGQSGHVYNQHNGSIDLVPDIDTQEFSVMLPALGDTIAQIWDIVYGGRKTNQVIEATNKRNTDIYWEDAQFDLARRGLRLVGQGGNSQDSISSDYNSYNKAAVNTIAGSINTMHDLIGMIITPGEKTSVLDKNVDLLDENRIYYDTESGEYYRKHLTYDYIEDEVEYTYTKVTDIKPETFDPSLYYELNENNEYVPATGEYDPNKEYFARGINLEEDYKEIDVELFDGSKYRYIDFNGSPYAFDEFGNINMGMCDYIGDPIYYPGKTYYEIDEETDLVVQNLAEDYEENKFYRVVNGSFVLDSNEIPSPLGANEYYYTIIPPKTIGEIDSSIKYDGIYTPHTYYYKDEATGNFLLATSSGVSNDFNVNEHLFYLPSDTEVSTDSDGTVGIYAKTTTWESVGPLDITTYVKGVYYLLEDPEAQEKKYIGPLYDEWQENKTYYVPNTLYTKIDNNQVIIDTGVAYRLTPFYSNVFFTASSTLDSGMLNVYTPLTVMSEVDKANTSTVYYAFGYTLDGEGANQGGTLKNGPFYDAAYQHGGLASGSNRYTAPYGIQKVNKFYLPHEYHYETGINDKNLCTSILLANYDFYSEDDKPYYKFVENFHKDPVSNKFYQPYKYYTPAVDENGQPIMKTDVYGNPTSEYADMILVTDETKPADIPLFEREIYYVKEDKAGILNKGAEWNSNVTLIPPTITLAKREERYELQLMQGFARNLNTAIGLILKLNKTIEMDDSYTRDERNANGLMNKLKDIIAYFGKIYPKGIMISDNYGRIVSSDWTTIQDQTLATKNANDLENGKTDKGVKFDIYPEAADVAHMRNQWLTLNVDGDVWNPKITLHHNFQPVTNTVSRSNMNINNPYYFSGEAADSPYDVVQEITGSTGDEYNKIQLYTPIVDNMGHVVGNNIETKTLPYSYRAFNFINKTDEGTDLVDSGSLVPTSRVNGLLIADNTQDLMTISAENKWIAFTVNAQGDVYGGDSFSIGHKLHSPNATQTEARATNLNADAVATTLPDQDNIILHDIVWDAAAHMLEDHPHTYTLPYGFKFITTGAASAAVTDLSHVATTIVAENTQDTVTFNSANIWMKLSADASNDSVTFGHLVRSITETDIANTNLNIDGSTVNNVLAENEDLTDKHHINIQDITHDEAGHIRSRQTHTYTLPFGYKFITTNGSVGDTTTDIVSNTNIAKAINTQDTFSIDVGNTWLKAAVDVDNRKITLYHYVKNNIDTTASEATDFNNISTGIFSLNDISFDEAGHMIANKSHQYTLPYSFKTFKHTNNSSVNDLDFTNYNAAEKDIVADNVVDEFTFIAFNKWIRLQAVPDSDQLQIAHLVNNFTPTNDTTSLVSTTTGDTTFTVVESIGKDEAGHLSAINTRQFTMPNSFGLVAITNNNVNNSTVLTTNSTGVEADCTHDTLTIAAADRWILLAGNADTDTITIGHALPDSTYEYDLGQTANASLNYGETFKVVHPKADKFGHIGELNEYTITLPSISLTNITNTSTANVLTGITLNSTTGAFEYTQANVSELQLTNYTYDESLITDTNLASGITINEAFARLQKQFTEEVAIGTGDRDVAIATAIQALDVENIVDDVTEIIEGENEGEEQEIVSQVSRLQPGKTLATLTETDGLINYTTQDIQITTSQIIDYPQNILLEDTQFDYAQEYSTEDPENPEQQIQVPYIAEGDPITTIQQLFAKVAELEARIAQLENP